MNYQLLLNCTKVHRAYTQYSDPTGLGTNSHPHLTNRPYIHVPKCYRHTRVECHDSNPSHASYTRPEITNARPSVVPKRSSLLDDTRFQHTGVHNPHKQYHTHIICTQCRRPHQCPPLHIFFPKLNRNPQSLRFNNKNSIAQCQHCNFGFHSRWGDMPTLV
jgi:hypothetical protein